MAGRFLSIGECMVELSQAGDGLLRQGFAGDTFNTAWYARACLPADWQVDYYTALGDDAVSQDLLDFMGKADIGTTTIRRIAGRMPGLYMIHLNDGERSFSYWRSTSAAKLLAGDPDHLRATIEAADLVYFSGITIAILSPADRDIFLSEARRAKASGKPVAFDPNLRPRLWEDLEAMRETVSAAARASSLVLPSFDDEATYFGDSDIAATVARYQALGAQNVVVKNGPDGATVAFGAIRERVPATSVDHVVDTTSAGDSFNGAFLAKYIETGEPVGAAAFGAQIAARVIGEHGALVRL